MFDVLSDTLIGPFSVTPTLGDSVVARRVFQSCIINVPNRVTWVDLGELDIVDFLCHFRNGLVACFFFFH